MLNKLSTLKSSQTSSSSSSLSSSSSSSTAKMTNNGQQQPFSRFMWIFVLAVLVTYFGTSFAYPANVGLMMTRKYPVNVEVENPEELISTLDNLIQNILVGIDSSHLSSSSSSNNNLQQQLSDKNSGPNKRGIDLGLSRGFSGSQAAKHMMGMSAASFANGPGRRRRR